MARSASAAVLGHVVPRAEFRGIRRRDDRLKPARGIMLGLGLSSLFWAGLATAILI